MEIITKEQMDFIKKKAKHTVYIQVTNKQAKARKKTRYLCMTTGFEGTENVEVLMAKYNCEFNDQIIEKHGYFEEDYIVEEYNKHTKKMEEVVKRHTVFYK